MRNILSALCIAMFAFACNDAEVSEVLNDDKAPVTAVKAPAGEFVPFDVVVISHTVKDYKTWRPAFDADAAPRKASGLELMVVGKSMDNPNDVTIVLTAADVQKAKAFAGDPRLKDVMGKAGVTGKPDVQFYNVIRHNPDAKEPNWMTVTHKVKDFNNWIKVFDSEGEKTRAEQGLYDAALARGIDDPNLVHIVFDIKAGDVERVKTAINSQQKRALMDQAGVEGMPVIHFYTTAEK